MAFTSLSVEIFVREGRVKRFIEGMIAAPALIEEKLERSTHMFSLFSQEERTKQILEGSID
ncbi:hypothetical protein ATN88_06540 [Enterovibrio coralii]|uniref:Uncharacterized protein n=1 Tax=Enterovibrio coralii TaxID=294935 RepID=A0A135ICX4_9GAMM|nr:hypothetical protein ATN88_06540 [Enterovibrio coralii]